MRLLRPMPWVSQPTQPVGIDWSNPVTQKLVGVVAPSNGGIYEATSGRRINPTTDYSGPVTVRACRYGLEMVSPVNGGAAPQLGRRISETTGSCAWGAAFFIKDGSISAADLLPIVGSDGGTSWANGSSSTHNMMYWDSPAGERKLCFRNCWSTSLTISTSGVADGFHVAVGMSSTQAGIVLVLDGAVVASSSPRTMFHAPSIAVDTVRSPTMASSGIGGVMLKTAWYGLDDLATAIAFTRNPWQIFASAC